MNGQGESAARHTFSPPVFWTSTGILLVLVLYASVFQANAQEVFGAVQT